MDEAKDRLIELIDAALQGEKVVIIKVIQESVELVPVVSTSRRQFGSAQGMIVMTDDFDSPIPDFGTDLP